MEPLMQTGPEHEEMAELAGTWKTITRMWMDPSAPPTESEGTAVRTLILDGRVLEEIFKSDFMGQPFEGRAQTGYDNVTARYWGTWTDNMGTGVTILYGGWNEAKDTFIMEGESPNPMHGKLIPMRIESRMDGPDREIDDFFMPGPDGAMVKNMEIIYERQ